MLLIDNVDNSLFIIKPENYVSQSKIAAFDMDHTLTYAERHLFPREETDVYLLPNRKKKLEQLYKDGYQLLLFTNQYSKSKKEKLKRVNRVKTFLNKLDLPMIAYIATDKNNYRKPDIGAWQHFLSTRSKEITESFFCGDAIGRPQDWSDSDKQFAINAKLKLIEPEKFFSKVTVKIDKDSKNAIIFMGMPGSGKTSFYRKYLENYTHIEQDSLKTFPKVLKQIEINCDTGENIVVDATNPSRDKRKQICDIIDRYNYKTSIIYFVNDGRGWNNLRDKDNKVSTITYHVYFKKLDKPNIDNDNVHKIWEIDGMNSELIFV